MFPGMPLGIAAFIAVLASLIASQLAAQTVMEKAARDETATVADTDPVMAAAMRKAQATLADFLKLAAAPRPGTEAFAVKVAVREGERGEYFWITPFTIGAGQLSGEINNTPRIVHSVKLGQTITFAQSDVVDWMYIENGRMKGNYTGCALLKSAPKNEAEEFKNHFGLNCDS
jgi:uncharacterized protein YegJ (DUF2314 family)